MQVEVIFQNHDSHAKVLKFKSCHFLFKFAFSEKKKKISIFFSFPCHVFFLDFFISFTKARREIKCYWFNSSDLEVRF